MEKEVKEIVDQFFKKLGQEVTTEVTTDEEGSTRVTIDTEDPGVLIGFHGKTLSSIQLLLGLMVYRRLDKWVQLVVDVNHYRQEQTERLAGIARSAAMKVRDSGEPVSLSPMTPFERRVVHLALSDFKGVETKSEGEDINRHVVISPVSLKG